MNRIQVLFHTAQWPVGRQRMLIGLLGSICLLSACQTTAPLSPIEQLNLGLGFAQSAHPKQAEQLLLKARERYLAAGDELNAARASFALGELYKSQKWQATLKPPANMQDYKRSAEAYTAAMRLYAKQEAVALAGSASMGTANAYLLADELGSACQAFEQAQRFANDPRAAQNPVALAQLTRSMQFFAALNVVCPAMAHH